MRGIGCQRKKYAAGRLVKMRQKEGGKMACHPVLFIDIFN